MRSRLPRSSSAPLLACPLLASACLLLASACGELASLPSERVASVGLLQPQRVFELDTALLEVRVRDDAGNSLPDVPVRFGSSDSSAVILEALDMQRARLIVREARPVTLIAEAEGRRDSIAYTAYPSPLYIELRELAGSISVGPSYNFFRLYEVTAPAAVVRASLESSVHLTNDVSWRVLSQGTLGQPDTAIVSLTYNPATHLHEILPLATGLFRLQARVGRTVAETTFLVRGPSAVSVRDDTVDIVAGDTVRIFASSSTPYAASAVSASLRYESRAPTRLRQTLGPLFVADLPGDTYVIVLGGHFSDSTLVRARPRTP